jgi:hypothetical protein
MALSTTFEIIKQLNSGMLKGAKELIKKEGYTGSDTVILMNTTSGKVLFDVADRQKLDETLVKVTGDVIQGIILKPLYAVGGIGFVIDMGLLASGNSLGNLFLDVYVGIKGTSFSQGYIYKPEGLMVNGVYMPGEYFRVTTITENGRTRIATDANDQFIGAEVISKSMYESVHPDYNDLQKARVDALTQIDNITSSFSPDHIVNDENGVLKVTFPDGHIEAEGDNTDNIFVSGDKKDYFLGNGGYDTYITGNGDIVQDSDGKGLVKFHDIDLTGTKTLKKGTTDTYEDDDFIYKKDANGNLIVSKQTSTADADPQDSITINNFKDKDLGITLQKTQDIDINVGDASAPEAAQQMQVEVEILRELGDAESLDVELGYYYNTYKTEYYGPEIYVAEQAAYTTPIVQTRVQDSYTGSWTTYSSGGFHPAQAAYTYRNSRQVKTGEAFAAVGSLTFTKADGQTQDFTYTWQDDKKVGISGNSHIVSYNETTKQYSYTSTPSITLTTKKDDSSSLADDIKVTTIRQGTLTIEDDDEMQRTDPLVLDVNKDGFISTTALTDSNTYFDITGDGLRERVGWVTPEDGLLTLDKNANGQIDGISELFGSTNESGVQELKRLVDSNYDNTINQADELYNRLQVWRDKNGDAIVQEGELTSLTQEGITSINLNAVNTQIEINGNMLSEASKYTDRQDNKELIADIQLATDAKDTQVNIADIPNYTIDESTRDLPNIKGSGLVYDAFIRYNTDEAFKALAEVYANDSVKTAEDFTKYVESYSGYTSYIDTLKERYSLSDDFSMQEADKEAWIVKRFEAESTKTIEDYYTTNLDNGKTPNKIKCVNNSNPDEREVA